VAELLAPGASPASDPLWGAPEGTVHGLVRLVSASRRERDRYAVLAWLASPAGAAALAALKDAVVADTRAAWPAHTYADTAAFLGISKPAVNAAVARHNRRTAQHPGGTQ
jgi:hypothetical protein